MTADKIISSDSHVIEPPDLWTSRIDTKFKEQAPRVISEENGDWWYIDGQRTNSFQGGAYAGVRFEHPEELEMSARWEDVRPGGFIPDERIKDVDIDGVPAIAEAAEVGAGVGLDPVHRTRMGIADWHDALAAVQSAVNHRFGRDTVRHN